MSVTKGRETVSRIIRYYPWRVSIVFLACAAAVVAIGAVVYSQLDRGGVGTAGSSRVVVFIGDSYTHGTGSSSKAMRWSSLVSAAAGWTEQNLGRGGTGYKKTSSKNGCGLQYCPNYAEMVAQAAALHPGVVVVSGGQNDFRSDFAEVEPMISKTYSDLRAALPDAEIIAVGPSIIGTVGPSVIGFDAAVQSAAAAVGARYVSLSSPDVLEPSMATEDGGHVADSGHAAIAAAVVAGLK